MTDIKAKLETLRSRYEADSKDLFNEFIDQVFQENPELHRIVVRGWTPGFNDGDPCVHSQDVMVSTSSFPYHGEGEHLFTYEEGYKFTGSPDERREVNADLDDNVAGEIEAILHGFEDYLYRIYNSNWVIEWRRQDNGHVGYSKDEYQCGY